MKEPIKVVLADDSPFICRLLKSYLEDAGEFVVVGTAMDGARAVELIQELRPAVATLDLEMPEMNGLAALEQIMHDSPTAVVLITGASRRAAELSLQAIGAGAVDFILKYAPSTSIDPEALKHEIIAKVQAASRIRTVRSVRAMEFSDRATFPMPTAPRRSTDQAASIEPSLSEGVIVIGASTGGPVALRELLAQLPADFPAAILIIQHMPANFTPVLAAQLDRQAPMRVMEAVDDASLCGGIALVAPGDRHLLISPDARIQLTDAQEVGGHRPSIDVTMQSIAPIFGSHAYGVLLSGMGSDGVSGLAAIRSHGGSTFVQDPATSIVSGMPDRALEAGLADYILSPGEIAEQLKGMRSADPEG